MKKKYIIAIFVVGFILIVLGIFEVFQYWRVKNAKIEIELVDNLTVQFYDKKKVSDFIVSINGSILDDYEIDTTKVGFQEVSFRFINEEKIKVSYTYKIEVVDTVAPQIWLGNRYSVAVGSEDTLIDSIFSGDNYDHQPKRYIEGEYDLNTVGEYSLVFHAVDSSGNEARKAFRLNVYEPKPKGGSVSSKKEYTYFSDVLTQHKSSTTRIGIDVSHWQEDIDFSKIKEAGVEFIMIRLGGTRGTNGEYFIDKKFEDNIRLAREYDIDVGVYFYSYANSIESAKRDAYWVLEQLKGYDLQLPIAFDWEEWKYFTTYHLSFFGLTSMAEAFLNVVEENGYQGMLYSSKTYLEKVWFPTKYDIWLAHYAKQTDYQGQYRLWQVCDNGKIDGIRGEVDIDVLYY